MADNLILVTVKSKTIGSDNVYRDNNIKPSNVVTYTTPQQQVVDTLNLATPIRYNTSSGLTYFSVRDNASTQKENRNVGISYYTCTDTLTDLANRSSGLIPLTVAKRRLEVISNEIMLFQTSKMIGVVDVDAITGNSRFQYLEDGDPNLVMYEVTQTPAQIAASGANPVFNMNGYELYVNDVVGNDATAEFGNPLLPWATFDGAMSAAILGGGQYTIIVTGDKIQSNNNAFAPGVNIEIRPSATLVITNYTASGSNGGQTISGEGELDLNTPLLLDSTFSNVIDINIGTLSISGENATGISNQSTSGGIVNVICNHSYMSDGCNYLYSVTGTSAFGSFITNISHTDKTNFNGAVSTFFIKPSALIAGDKYFNFYLAAGNSYSSKEGLITLSGIDSTYNISAKINVDYDGSSLLPALNAILVAYNCTGGKITLKGTHNILNQGMCSLILNSNVTVYDYSNTYSTAAISVPIIYTTGGASYYTMYGKKLSPSTFSVGSIILGHTFTSGNPTPDFGTPTGTAGTDTLHFKGGLKCTWLNNSAIGIGVYNANPNLVIDGGTIEMVQSNTATSSIKGTAQNMKVLGTGFVRGAVTGMTNTITGTNIIQDAGITANIA